MRNQYVVAATRWWLAALCFVSVTLSAQAQSTTPPVIQWQRVIEIGQNSPTKVVKAYNGGYGLIASGHVVRLSESGTTIWETYFSGSSLPGSPSNQKAEAVIALPDGGFGVLLEGLYQWSLARLDAAGTVLWIKPFVDVANRGGAEATRKVTGLIRSNEGGFIVIGNTQLNRNGTYVDLYKFDADGNSTTTVRFGSYTTEARSTSVGNRIIQTPDGGYFMVGYTFSISQQRRLGWAVKLNAQLQVIQQNQYEERTSLDDVILNPYFDGSFIASGLNNLNSDVTNTLNIGPDGAPGGGYYQPGRVVGSLSSIVAVPSKNGAPAFHTVLDATTTNGGDFRLTNLAQSDQLVWAKTLGGSGIDVPEDIIATDDGGYLLVGTTTSTDGDVQGKSTNSPATWVVKLRNVVPVNALTLTQPTYNCSTGAISFNTSGGDGSPITYNAPGISRLSAASNSGTVEQGLRNDPKPITITATQSGQSATYVLDLQAACAKAFIAKPPVLLSPIPDQTITIGQAVQIDLGGYFSDPTVAIPHYFPDWSFSVTALPNGLRGNYGQGKYTPDFSIGGNPMTAGVYSVTLTARTAYFPDQPVSAIFNITVVDQPVVNPPAPPTGGTLAMSQPTYNCSTGAISFNTTGGDGSPITYNAPGISRTSATSNSGTVEQGLRNDPKSITITATQSGQTASYTFDFGAFCSGPQPPVTPPTPPVNPPSGSSLTLLAPSYDCASGAITFRTSGGNGSAVEYASPGITGWTTNPNQFVDRDSRTANDVKPFTLMARQNGVMVTYVWDLKAACGRARLSAGERVSDLSVSLLGNPVSDAVTVEVRGAEGQPLLLRLVDLKGHVVESRSIEQAGGVERQRFELPGAGPALLLLRVSSGTQSQTVKILKQ